MRCLFCRCTLQLDERDSHIVYWCDDSTCMVDDMIRYQAMYNKYPTYIVMHKVMLDKYYLVIDYFQKTTTISILEKCVLVDSVTIPRVLPIDFKNPNSVIGKIKTLMLFS